MFQLIVRVNNFLQQFSLHIVVSIIYQGYLRSADFQLRIFHTLSSSNSILPRFDMLDVK